MIAEACAVPPPAESSVLVGRMTTRRYMGITAVAAQGGHRRPPRAIRALLRDKSYQARVREDVALHKDLIRRYQAGEPGTGELLLRVNLPLLRKVAIRYARAWEDEIRDHFQEARLALLEAASRYDPTRGASPHTWYWQYVRSYVRRHAIDVGSVVRFPVAHYGKRHPPELRKQTLRNPVTRTFSDMEVRWSQDDLSFEESLIDDKDLAPDIMGDGEVEAQMPFVLDFLLDGLPARHIDVLRKRFCRPVPLMLQEIGDEYGVSRERIRQIEAEALELARERAELYLQVDPKAYRTFEEWVIAACHALRARRKTPPHIVQHPSKTKRKKTSRV